MIYWLITRRDHATEGGFQLVMAGSSWLSDVVALTKLLS